MLLDAPCTATGAIRRHPDVPHLKQPEDVARLAVVQENLLRAAVEMLRPGGTLVYCTCSLEPEEGPRRIEALLRSRRAGRAPADRRRTSSARRPSGSPPRAICAPCRAISREYDGIDGFYGARLVKHASA